MAIAAALSDTKHTESMAKPIDFPESNITFLPPGGEETENCTSLRAFNDGTQTVSLWKLTRRERWRVFLTGKIWLLVWGGKSTPPVCVDGSKTVFLPKQEPVSPGISKKGQQ